MVGPQQISFGEVALLLFAKNALVFTLIKNECSSFSATAFGFRFRLDLRSDFVISFHQGEFLPLIFIGFHQERCL
jgi:hypothetical protein